MAEYKGLTIRIGGDTSQLNAALKASTKAASSLESQIRQINRAIRFDPGDFGNLNTKVKLTENRMEALYSKLTLVRNGYSELGKQAVTVGGEATTVKKLADATENISLAATTAKERYNDMTSTLAAKYRELEIRAKEAGQAMDLNALSRQDSGNTFESQMAELKELGVVTDEEIQKLREMRTVWNEAFDSAEAYKAAEQYSKMGIDMQRIRSEAEGMAASLREVNTVSKYSNNVWSESNAKIKSMDSALSDCAKQAKAYEAALREDPSNLSAAVGRLQALSNEYEITTGKANELSRQIDAYKSRLSGVLAEQKNLPLYIQEMGDKWQEVQTEIAEAKGKADALKQSLQRLKDAQAPEEEIKKLQAQVDEADGKVKELNASAKAMDAAFETSKECAELQQLQGEYDETIAHASNLRRQMDMTNLGGKNFLNASTIKSAGMTLYSTLTPAITMLGWRAVSAAQDIDSAYRDMRKTVSGTEAQFEELKQAAIDFSKTHVTSAEQILDIMAIGGELGIATESLQAFAETVSNLDVATNLDTEQAASSLGKLANITHMTAEEYDNYADALVRLGNNGASTEDQIVDIATRIGSMGTIIGMTVPEILALSSSIASTGMKTEASGTAISNTFSMIESAVAAGGDDLEAFAKIAQTSSEDFASSWENKPIEAFKAFVEGLNRIEADGGSAVATLESIGITGERQKQSILGLMQTIGGLNTNLEMAQHAWDGQSDAWGEAGDAAREAQRKAEGFSGQLAILQNIADDAMASLADGAAPLIAVFTDLAQSALSVFDEMNEGDKTMIVLALGIGAVIGPLLTMISTFITASNTVKAYIFESNAMIKAMAVMKTGFASAGSGVDGFKLKLATLGQTAKIVGKELAANIAPIAIIAGITLLVSAISDYIAKMKKLREASRSAGDVIGSALGRSLTNQKRAISDLADSYDEMISKIADHNKAIHDSAVETYRGAETISQYGEALKDALAAYNDDKSARNLGNLKTQLELYNEAAGTAITLTEDENGNLQLMKDNAVLSAEAFDSLTKSMMNAAKAEFFKESYSKKMEDYYAALEGVDAAARKVADAENKLIDAAARGADGYEIKDLSQKLHDANEEYNNTVSILGNTETAMSQYEEGMRLMSEAQLENASAITKWVAQNDELQVALWGAGESVFDFIGNLEDLGVSYEELEAHADGIELMAANWDGSIGSMIASLQAMGVEIDLSQVKIDGLNAVQIADKTYYVDDMGTIFDQTGKVVGLAGALSSVSDATYQVTDGNTTEESEQAVDNLNSAIASIPPSTTANVNASVYGADSVNSLYSTLLSLSRGWTTTVTVFKQEVSSATGSVASSPYIPRHAAGYIATGPTLTNNGWVGEAGAEAILNWGTGGAVIPLTNTKYMEPIANAIASQMNNGGDTTIYNVSLSDFAINDDEEIRAATDTYIKTLARKAAMNRG